MAHRGHGCWLGSGLGIVVVDVMLTLWCERIATNPRVNPYNLHTHHHQPDFLRPTPYALLPTPTPYLLSRLAQPLSSACPPWVRALHGCVPSMVRSSYLTLSCDVPPNPKPKPSRDLSCYEGQCLAINLGRHEGGSQAEGWVRLGLYPGLGLYPRLGLYPGLGTVGFIPRVGLA